MIDEGHGLMGRLSKVNGSERIYHLLELNVFKFYLVQLREVGEGGRVRCRTGEKNLVVRGNTRDKKKKKNLRVKASSESPDCGSHYFGKGIIKGRINVWWQIKGFFERRGSDGPILEKERER